MTGENITDECKFLIFSERDWQVGSGGEENLIVNFLFVQQSLVRLPNSLILTVPKGLFKVKKKVALRWKYSLNARITTC